MSGWTTDELERIGRVNELQVASRRPDGSLRPFVTIWVVRSGDPRSINEAGPENGRPHPRVSARASSRDRGWSHRSSTAGRPTTPGYSTGISS